MHIVRSISGPFRNRPYYDEREIERICLQELRATGLLPTTPAPVKIDRFLEKKFGVTHEYADLADGILGLTEFGPNGVEAVFVSRALAEESDTASERRVSSTIAHEAGHGLLHARLFANQGKQETLFEGDQDVQREKILCRKNSIVRNSTNSGKQYDGKWWEFQANKAMGALLLPRPLVLQAINPYLHKEGLLGTLTLPESMRLTAERSLAEIFDVNPIVVRIRLKTLLPTEVSVQMSL